MFRSLPVLMYHSISRFTHRLCVAPELFDDHCRTLAKAGWRGVSLAEAEAYFLRKRRLPRKTLFFTFDDGYLDNYANAEPILRAHGHCGVVFTVIDLMDNRDILRPAMDDIPAAPSQPDTPTEPPTPLPEGFDAPLPNLDARPPVWRDTGYRVSPIIFCSWKELAAMRQKGTMDVAPHSMRHSRVIADLSFTRLYEPAQRYSFFDVAPEKAVWGMPRFRLTHGLAHRGYILHPELYACVKAMVPQHPKEAHAFLSQKENRQTVIDAIRRLPQLGTLESEESYRKRLAEEFTACREAYITRLGITPKSFCWPWGSYTTTAMEEAHKAGFRVFFTTLRGMNFYGRPKAVCRLAVRGGTGEELLAKVTAISAVLPELPFEFYKWTRRLWQR